MNNPENNIETLASLSINDTIDLASQIGDAVAQALVIGDAPSDLASTPSMAQEAKIVKTSSKHKKISSKKKKSKSRKKSKTNKNKKNIQPEMKVENNNNNVIQFQSPPKEVETQAQAIVKKGKGRPSLVPEHEFLQVLRTAKQPDDVILAFPRLQQMAYADAKQYVAMRATNLRNKFGVAQVPVFRKGRKKSAPPMMTSNNPNNNNIVSPTLDTSPAMEEHPVVIVGGGGIPVPSTRRFFEE